MKNLQKWNLYGVMMVLSILLFGSTQVLAEAYEDDLVPQNEIPLVILRVDESEEAISQALADDDSHVYGKIEDMKQSVDHSVRCVGTFEMVLPDGFQSEYGSNSIPSGEVKLSYIRGRGNSTWALPKKPYKIKFDKKQDILGMGENKEWGLLANAMDKTQLNNAIAMWLGNQMGLEFTVKMVPVDVIMIGSESGQKYLGSYYMTELTDIGKNRVDIPELKEDSVEDITGGYLISLYYDSQDYDESRSTVFEVKKSGVQFINENPYFENEDLTEAQKSQREYIRNYVEQIDDIIMSHDTIDEETHNQLASLMDFESMANVWLMQEFLVNYDAFKTSSNYWYKKPNDKLYWGPLWDFDLIFFDFAKDEPTLTTGFNNAQAFSWVDRLRTNDPLLSKMIQERWKVMDKKIEEITKMGGILDQYKERQKHAWNANDAIWGDVFYYEKVNYDAEIETLRSVLDYRRQWFNEHIDEVGDVYFTVSFEVDGNIEKQETVRGNSYIFDVDIHPIKEGYLFKQWVNKETGKSIYAERINRHTTFVPEFVSIEEIAGEVSMYFSTHEVWMPLEDSIYDSLSVSLYPSEYDEVLRNSLIWKSSNEEVATVEEGIVQLLAVGETTITATLYNGVSQSYLLHVYDSDRQTIDEPTDFVIEQEEYTIEVGETAQIVWHLLPNEPLDPNTYIDIDCRAENDEMVEVSTTCKSFIGLKPGTTTIQLEVYSSVSDKTIFEKDVTVNVVPSNRQTTSGSNQNDKSPIWSKIDDWADEEMKKATELGIIPEILRNKDFTQPIDRTQFAAVAVKLYEKISGKKAELPSKNPFIDTSDANVLKAYGLGITNGTSANTFTPDRQITREQMATMIARSLEKAGIDTKVNLEQVSQFVDDRRIGKWAKSGVYFMASKEILKGTGENVFSPLGNAKIEEAIATSLRCVETFK